MSWLIQVVVGYCIYAAALLLGTWVARVSDRSFGKALLATFLGYIGSAIAVVVVFFATRPDVNRVAAMAAATVVMLFVIKWIFDTTWVQSLIALVVQILALTVAFVAVAGVLSQVLDASDIASLKRLLGKS